MKCYNFDAAPNGDNDHELTTNYSEILIFALPCHALFYFCTALLHFEPAQCDM